MLLLLIGDRPWVPTTQSQPLPLHLLKVLFRTRAHTHTYTLTIRSDDMNYVQ